ncbi:MAG: trypsin-like peptidase domain-containing protein [Nitrospiraceae bacterium]|nr:trypsin-like peptidase domain-containing protein [Nitrospiraceae bacterium]
MRLVIWGTLFGLSLILSTVAIGKELSPREIYEQASPAVVMVMGYADGGRKGSGGTGSVIQSDGLVLTNAHVVIEERTGKPFPRLSVFLKPARVTGESTSDLSRMVRAKVVAYSQPLDLALLKLEGLTGQLPVVEVSESGQARIGDRVVAIGHPEQGGLWTLTTGVVSAEVDNFNGVKGKHVFQTETGLNRGNSGGPLLDGEGQMIGVNTAIARVASDGLPITSISFSLKSNVAAQWLREQGVGAERQVGGKGVSRIDQTELIDQPTPSVQPQAKPAQPHPSDLSLRPTMKPDVAQPAPVRPYNLDQLINDRARAEADLGSMMSEMRGQMKGR